MHFDGKVVAITIASTLLLVLDAYHDLTPGKPWDRALLFFVIPLLVIVLGFREHPREYGLTFGDWKAGILLTVLGILLMAPILYWVGQYNEAMRSYYQGRYSGLPWATFFDLLGCEFLFRGWILFGYARKLGATALWLQAVPFTLTHLGKPELETFGVIFGGFAFGWIAWRTKSFVWPLLLHWFVATFMIVVAAGVLG